MWDLFNTTLLVEVEIAILKYRSHLHFLKCGRITRINMLSGTLVYHQTLSALKVS
jgi:hypothetical protein